MLTQVAEGVLVHESECLQSNSTIVRGDAGVLLVDPGLTTDELESIAADLDEPVVAGFSTHPDWDHVLWHPNLGDAPRFGTAVAAASLAEFLAQPDWRVQATERLPEEVADDVPMHLFGLITALPAGAAVLPWDGPTVRILEHKAHSPGHAALLIDDRGVLVAGDMLSDVLVPMLDLHRSAHPIGDYLAALDLLERESGSVEVFVPGHGSVGDATELERRIAADRAYVEALRDGRHPDDPRIGHVAKPGWEWVVYIHENQVERLG